MNLANLEMISNRLEEIKKKFGWSSAQLGNEAGASKQAVNKWLNHNSEPGWEFLNRLKQKYGISDLYILKGEGPMIIDPSPDEFLNQMRSYWPHLGDEEKRLLCESAKRYAASTSKQNE